MAEMENQPAISTSLKENTEYLNDLLGVGKSFDIVAKEFRFDNCHLACYCINGFFQTNSNVKLLEDVTKVIDKFLKGKQDSASDQDHLVEFLNTNIPFVQVGEAKTMENALLQLLSGPMVLFIDGYDVAIAIDQRVYPARGPQEPETERVIRGPRDGYTETLLTNTALTRRRVRDPRLRMEIMQVGKRSKTDVCLAYIEDITNPELVETVRSKLKEISTDGIPMAEQSLDEYLVGARWNPYPLVRYTERPDVAAVNLLQGFVLLFVDTTPEVIILPTTFFQHLDHPEDYHMRPAVGTYMRWVILLAMLMSIFLPSIWLEVALRAHDIPDWLSFMKPKDLKHQLSLPWQVIMVEIGIDVFRRAVVNTPVPVASAIGLISGLVFGQFSVKIGLISSDALVYIAIATVGSFATSSPELANANRIFRVFLVILVAIFHLWGLIGGAILWFFILGRTKTFGIPYLWPVYPFNWRELRRILIREPASKETTRPSILRTKDTSKK